MNLLGGSGFFTELDFEFASTLRIGVDLRTGRVEDFELLVRDGSEVDMGVVSDLLLLVVILPASKYVGNDFLV